MKQNYDLIVFDWDGTLMDSAGLIAQSIQRAAADVGLPIPDDAAARHIIGLGLSEALQALFPAADAATLARLVDRYRVHFLGQDHMIPLFDGAAELVRQLHAQGRYLAVATGKSRRGLERALEYSQLGELFLATRCADESFSKPHPAMLLELMDELAVDKARTLMIGDTSHDLQMAINAGVAALAVTYGAHEHAHLLDFSPLACCHSIDELAQWLRQNG